MKSLAISGAVREQLGKTGSNQIRRENKVPCVLYGGEDNVHFSADERSFKKLVYTPDIYEVKLDIAGKEYRAVMKDIQFHPVTDRILHIDFVEMFEDRTVTVDLPVSLEGTSIGVRNGGVLRFARPRVKVKGLPSALPDNIEINIEELDIGDSIKIGDLDPGQIEFLESENAVVVRIKIARQLIETVTEEEEEVDLESMTDEEREEYEKKQAEEAEAAAEGGEQPTDSEGEEKKDEGGGKEGRDS